VLCDSGDGSFCRKVPTKRTVPAVADVLDINPDPAGYTPMGGVYFAGQVVSRRIRSSCVIAWCLDSLSQLY